MLRKCQLQVELVQVQEVDNKFKIEIGVLDINVNIAKDVDLTKPGS